MNYLSTIKKMREKIAKNEGFDVVIIVTSSGNFPYWQWRLQKTRNKILSPKTELIIVEEDWGEGGAGQLLGTLYGIKKASKKVDIIKALSENKSIAVYHTAGYGKRMAPLCGTEGNNKPGIKLPWPVLIEGKRSFFTLLEGVIFTTQAFAKTREGRVCVFWTDQIIIPSRSFRRETNLPVEIFAIKAPFSLNPNEWKRKWQRYGILIKRKGLGVVQREKLSWSQFKKLLEKLKIKPGPSGKLDLYKSLGCFSIDGNLLNLLMKEFSQELEIKKRNLETDIHLWMPLTTTRKEYGELGQSVIYWQRIKNLKLKYQKEFGKKLILGEKNLGEDTIWWDYGNLASYHESILRLISLSVEGKVARELFEMSSYFISKKKEKNLYIKNSIVFESQIDKGQIKNSVILSSNLKWASLERGAVIKSRLKGIRGRNLLLYYVEEDKRLKVQDREVLTDIVIPGGTRIRMRTTLLRDSKKDWTVRLPQNPFSYSEVERCLARLADGAFKIKLARL
jgi:hypothetical protein